MSEEGQICRTIAQKALDMDSPCIKIVPSFDGKNLEEWAKLYFYVSEMVKSISDKLNVKMISDVSETGAKEAMCPDSDDGYHELMNLKNKITPEGTFFCIHCGFLARKTRKNTAKLKEFFESKQFKRKEIPRERDDELPF